MFEQHNHTWRLMSWHGPSQKMPLLVTCDCTGQLADWLLLAHPLSTTVSCPLHLPVLGWGVFAQALGRRRTMAPFGASSAVIH